MPLFLLYFLRAIPLDPPIVALVRANRIAALQKV